MKRILAAGAAAALAAAVVAAQPVAAGPAPLNPLQEKFMAELAARAEAAEKAEAMTVIGKDGWLFFGPELRHVSVGPFWGERAAEVSRASAPDDADPLPPILDFSEQLQKRGIDLILLPVPPKAVVYPDAASAFVGPDKDGAVPRLDGHHQAFYDLLRAKGVSVLDLADLFLKNRAHADGAMYCRQDTHWSGVACVLAAQALAREIKAKPWYKDVPRREYASEWREREIAGDLLQFLPKGAEPPSKERLRLRFVGTKSGEPAAAGPPAVSAPADLAGGGPGRIEPVKPDADSPVVLMGDSHTLVFHGGAELHAVGAGLADQLALELGFPVELIGTRGSGATPVRLTFYRRSVRDPGYLKKKRIVVWCLSAREFTEAFQGWQKVPVAP